MSSAVEGHPIPNYDHHNLPALINSPPDDPKPFLHALLHPPGTFALVQRAQTVRTAPHPTSPPPTAVATTAPSLAHSMAETKKKSRSKAHSRPNHYNSNTDGYLFNGQYVTPSARHLYAVGEDAAAHQFDPNLVVSSNQVLDPATGLPLPPRPEGPVIDLAFVKHSQPSSSSDTPADSNAATDDGKKQPPRPPNKWMLFRCDFLRRVGSLGTDLDSSIDPNDIQAIWHNSPPSVHEYYTRLAALTKIAHKKEFPDYKYRPQTKQRKEKEAREKAAEEQQAKQTKREDMKPPSRRMPRRKNEDGDDDDDDDGEYYRPTSSRKPVSKRSTPPEPRRAGPRIRDTYTPYKDRSPADVADHDDVDMEDDDEELAANGPSQETPVFTAGGPMYQPPAFSDESAVASNLPIAEAPQPVTATAPTGFDLDSGNNIWPSIAAGVGWSNALPLNFQDNPLWIQPTLNPAPAHTQNANGNTLAAYSNWNTSTGPDPEVRMSLPHMAELGGIDLLIGNGPGSTLTPEDLAMGLNLNVTPQVGTGEPQFTINPAAMHTPPTADSTNLGLLQIPMTPRMNPITEELDSNAWCNLVNGFIAHPENAPSPEDPVIPTPTHDGPLPALPVIQGMSMDDYAIATGSGGMGAVVHETPYMQALGVTIDGPAPTSMNLVRNCAEASLLLSEQIREEGWHIADDGAVKYMGTEDIEDCDRSFGSMVSFGSEDGDQVKVPRTERVPSVASAKSGTQRSFKPPSGASKFAVRKVAGQWNIRPQSRSVSMESSKSMIIHPSPAHSVQALPSPQSTAVSQSTPPPTTFGTPGVVRFNFNMPGPHSRASSISSAVVYNPYSPNQKPVTFKVPSGNYSTRNGNHRRTSSSGTTGDVDYGGGMTGPPPIPRSSKPTFAVPTSISSSQQSSPAR